MRITDSGLIPRKRLVETISATFRRAKNYNQSSSFEFETLESFVDSTIKLKPNDVFGTPNPNIITAGTNIGNLFLTKFSNLSQLETDRAKKKADPNVMSFLTNVRKEDALMSKGKSTTWRNQFLTEKGNCLKVTTPCRAGR